jgi:hypothetical protein
MHISITDGEKKQQIICGIIMEVWSLLCCNLQKMKQHFCGFISVDKKVK